MINTILSAILIAAGVGVSAYLWTPIVRNWLAKRHQQASHAADR